MGGLLGILTTGLNERLLRDHSLTYFLSLTFFILQTLASLLYYKRFKAIMALLILTLIMQMPLVYGGSFSYRNQTLFSLILQNGTKIWDVEPGSYISIQYAGFETNVKMSHNPKAIMGINLLPAFAVFVFLRERFFGQT